jgi:hypothetical protein
LWRQGRVESRDDDGATGGVFAKGQLSIAMSFLSRVWPERRCVSATLFFSRVLSGGGVVCCFKRCVNQLTRHLFAPLFRSMRPAAEVRNNLRHVAIAAVSSHVMSRYLVLSSIASYTYLLHHVMLCLMGQKVVYYCCHDETRFAVLQRHVSLVYWLILIDVMDSQFGDHSL